MLILQKNFKSKWDCLFYVHMPYHPGSFCQMICITLIQLVCKDRSNVRLKCQQYISSIVMKLKLGNLKNVAAPTVE